MLCIEMRIRMYHDGAMSKLLENSPTLVQDSDNPTVQLQGPFLIEKLAPPPAHRNVIMIAAGTGVDPMVQQIRSYLSIPRDTFFSRRSRLVLVWQSTTEADFYGTDDITALQASYLCIDQSGHVGGISDLLLWTWPALWHSDVASQNKKKNTKP
ncbi:unnamed protein product [Ectocarpus sp. 8 AP-2014]